jgi:hypothetical protein
MGRAELGHLPSCRFTNNFGPACDCDGLPPVEEAFGSAGYILLDETMERMGWERDDRQTASYHRTIGDHYIYVGRVISGWQFKWMRTPTWTIRESGSFGTVTHCMNALWKCVTEIYDNEHSAQRELYRYRMHTKTSCADELTKEAT